MLPIQSISGKEKLVHLIKGACKTELFFLFGTKRELSEKGQDGRIKWQKSGLEGNKVTMWVVASEKT